MGFRSKGRAERLGLLRTLAVLVLLFVPMGRAFASPQTLSAMLTGSKEVPSNSSPATGTCTASVDPVTL
jgi:hypothetical protein